MSTADLRVTVKEHTLGVTALLTLVGYGLVIGTFQGLIPLYPDIGQTGVDLLGHAIAIVNTLAAVSLAAGWYWIRNGEVSKHRAAMLSAFSLIILFLFLYLPKVGGGGEKHFVLEASYSFVPTWGFVYPAYLLMLAVHIILSAVAMPVVVYAVVLGLTHTPAELTETRHAAVGRVAAASWILSLVLGVLTYVLLNHLYTYEFVPLFLGL